MTLREKRSLFFLGACGGLMISLFNLSRFLEGRESLFFAETSQKGAERSAFTLASEILPTLRKKEGLLYQEILALRSQMPEKSEDFLVKTGQVLRTRVSKLGLNLVSLDLAAPENLLATVSGKIGPNLELLSELQRLEPGFGLTSFKIRKFRNDSWTVDLKLAFHQGPRFGEILKVGNAAIGKKADPKTCAQYWGRLFDGSGSSPDYLRNFQTDAEAAVAKPGKTGEQDAENLGHADFLHFLGYLESRERKSFLLKDSRYDRVFTVPGDSDWKLLGTEGGKLLLEKQGERYEVVPTL